VPIKGTFATFAEFVPPPQAPPFACPLPQGALLLGWVRVRGTGRVSHLGFTSFDNLQCVWGVVVGGPNGPVAIPTGLYGEVRFESANGDELWTTYDGDVVALDATHLAFRNGTMTFYGGTGRFAGATGAAPYTGGFTFETPDSGRGFLDLAGWISSVGSSRR
jgi:hypothetical protein